MYFIFSGVARSSAERTATDCRSHPSRARKRKQKYMRVLFASDGASEWPQTRPTGEVKPVTEGAQGLLEDNAERLTELLLSQYQGMTLGDVARGTLLHSLRAACDS